jgi:hypothetical protein
MRVVQSQEQLCFQAKGIQLVDVPSNEPQQPVTTYLLLHLIPMKQKERGKRGTTSTFNWLIFDTLVVIPTTKVERIIRWTKHHTSRLLTNHDYGGRRRRYGNYYHVA